MYDIQADLLYRKALEITLNAHEHRLFLERRASAEAPQPEFPLCLEKGPRNMFQPRKIPTKEMVT